MGVADLGLDGHAVGRGESRQLPAASASEKFATVVLHLALRCSPLESKIGMISYMTLGTCLGGRLRVKTVSSL